MLLDKLQIDDPVGAWPVHGLCGIWGCMAIGILPNTHLSAGSTSFMTQLIGTAAICGWAFVTMFILFAILKAVGILRVSEAEEFAGLDISRRHDLGGEGCDQLLHERQEGGHGRQGGGYHRQSKGSRPAPGHGPPGR